MYILFLRGNRWWFRNANPIDLVAVLSPQVQFSLRTENRSEVLPQQKLLIAKLKYQIDGHGRSVRRG